MRDHGGKLMRVLASLKEGDSGARWYLAAFRFPCRHNRRASPSQPYDSCNSFASVTLLFIRFATDTSRRPVYCVFLTYDYLKSDSDVNNKKLKLECFRTAPRRVNVLI